MFCWRGCECFEIGNVFNKNCREKHSCMFNNILYGNIGLCEIKNVVEPDRPRMTL